MATSERFGAVRGHSLLCREHQWPSGAWRLTYMCECGGAEYGITATMSQKAAYAAHRVHKAEVTSRG